MCQPTIIPGFFQSKVLYTYMHIYIYIYICVCVCLFFGGLLYSPVSTTVLDVSERLSRVTLSHATPKCVPWCWQSKCACAPWRIEVHGHVFLSMSSSTTNKGHSSSNGSHLPRYKPFYRFPVLICRVNS